MEENVETARRLLSMICVVAAILVTGCTDGATDGPRPEPSISEMIAIEPGTFLHGGTRNQLKFIPFRDFYRGTWVSEFTAHMTKPYWIGKYEVTQAEFEKVTGRNPALVKGPRIPITNISIIEAIEYCNKRSLLEGLTPCYKVVTEDVLLDTLANGYRLPTMAEWEYAARAGNMNNSHGGIITGAIPDDTIFRFVDEYAWNANMLGVKYAANFMDIEDSNSVHCQEVGRLKPNSWGLHDVLGNAQEMILESEFFALKDTGGPVRYNPRDKFRWPLFNVRGGSVYRDRDFMLLARYETGYYLMRGRGWPVESSMEIRLRDMGFRVARNR